MQEGRRYTMPIMALWLVALLSGAIISQAGAAATGAALAAGPPRRLNNLVTELLNIHPVADQRAIRYGLQAPREEWLYISAVKAARRPGDAQIFLDNNPILHLPRASSAATAERMCHVLAGKHEIALQADRPGIVERLIVRRIPALLFYLFEAEPNPSDWRFAQHYSWGFLRQHILPHCNVLVVASPQIPPAYLAEWQAEGRQCLVNRGLDYRRPEAAYETWAQHPGFADPFDGIIVDEFGPWAAGYAQGLPFWTAAWRRLRAAEAYRGKTFYAFTGSGDVAAYRPLVEALCACGYKIVPEFYLAEKPTEAAAQALLRQWLCEKTAEWRKAYPQVMDHFVLCLAAGCYGPRCNWDVCPEADFYVYLDMQMQLLATDPAFAGLYGVAAWTSRYMTEECIRRLGQLYRHYCLEGRTERLFRDPYELRHLANPGFEAGFAGWEALSAEAESLRLAKTEALPFKRRFVYEPVPEGASYIELRRSATRPNRLMQDVRQLQPGRLYSLRFYSWDVENLSTPGLHAVSVQLTNAAFLPEKTRQDVYAYTFPRRAGEGTISVCFNDHFRVFRAYGPSARLTLTDWASERWPGGPIGQRLGLDFVQIQPYLPEEGDVSASGRG